MIEFGNSVYYIDLKGFDKAITLSDSNTQPSVDKESKQTLNEEGKVIVTEVFERTTNKNKEIDGAKYDLLKTFIEYIIDSEEVSDDSLGADRALAEASFGYKIVFNTLYKEGIIKEKA
jgi:hypothetical protein